MSNPLVDFYRCPESLVDLRPAEDFRSEPGYFDFGPGATCYGRSAFGAVAKLNGHPLPDLHRQVGLDQSTLQLPFNLSEIVDNLRLERYPTNGHPGISRFLTGEAIRRAFYYLRPRMNDSVRLALQRLYFQQWSKLRFPKWPVDVTVDRLLERLLGLSMEAKNVDETPFIWFWPEGASCALMMTHDVEAEEGLALVPGLMDLDEGAGLKSAYQLVPEERYSLSKNHLEMIRQRGCEVNVHGLNHDGNLFSDRDAFSKRAEIINRYIQVFETEGFRSSCMYRNAEWLNQLQISYDMSVPNVAHLEPQRGGCCTVFPYFVGNILELPLTTIQDYSLLRVLEQYSTNLWKQQINAIMQQHGLISFIIHPDYIFEDRALPVYRELLAHLSRLVEENKVWAALPGDINRWWRERSQMKLVNENGRWMIQGCGHERARIAFAHKNDGEIVYRFDNSH